MRKKRKSLKELNLLDRFLFDEVMENPEAYAALLEIILGKDIFLKGLPQSEKEIRTLPSFRGIRLDVWGEDTEDNIYNSEVQKKDTRNLPRRSRYYQSTLDAGLLEPSSIDYNTLNDVCLIQIAPFDLFGQNRCMYTFRMRCDEDRELSLNDGAVRIFLNTRGTDTEGISNELLELLRYVEHSTADNAASSESPRLKKLYECVEAVKCNEQREVKYMQLWEEKAEERLEGKAAGLLEGKTDSIIELLEDAGTVPAPLRSAIKSQTDPNILRQWLHAAKKAVSIEDFIRICGNISL